MIVTTLEQQHGAEERHQATLLDGVNDRTMRYESVKRRRLMMLMRRLGLYSDMYQKWGADHDRWLGLQRVKRQHYDISESQLGSVVNAQRMSSRACEDKADGDKDVLAEIEQPKNICQKVFRLSNLPPELVGMIFHHLVASTIPLVHTSAEAGRDIFQESFSILAVCRTFKHEALSRLQTGVAAEIFSLSDSLQCPSEFQKLNSKASALEQRSCGMRKLEAKRVKYLTQTKHIIQRRRIENMQYLLAALRRVQFGSLLAQRHK
ncbi:hypothetical protein B0A48_14331 [Cryoendolithus antarcticus]|uniref:F-box domain-containing protein n=1 Tax=Cryoendolithus antarcticus TaxID=1507870 RepID=A0A1V8SJL4_9PEZI|nr:hypothetical protein B0A48_14331 [Cryoendolithus antarcticus]